jgi:hypothetical protein
MSDYLLKLHIEKPGTPYTDPRTRQASKSVPGHIWYEVIKADGTSLGTAAFASEEAKNHKPLPVQGKVWFSNGSDYAGDSYATATYGIKSSQAAALIGSQKNSIAYGFSLTYWAPTNSCVDFVWKGLGLVGMNLTGYEGALTPMQNDFAIRSLRNPALADGGQVYWSRLPDTSDNRPIAPDGVGRIDEQQVVQAGPNQRIVFYWQEDCNRNYQKVETVQALQANGIWKSTPLLIGQYDSSGAPKAGMYTATEITIVNKTTRAMNANGQALSDAQLAALDTNGDGQISTAEAAGTRLWADLNENGTLDSSELQGVVSAIKSADYGFYTRGSIARGLSMSDGAANAKHWRQVA